MSKAEGVLRSPSSRSKYALAILHTSTKCLEYLVEVASGAAGAQGVNMCNVLICRAVGYKVHVGLCSVELPVVQNRVEGRRVCGRESSIDGR